MPTTTPRRQPPQERRPLALDLLLVVVFVFWFYTPFLQVGIPPGDFTSDVAMSTIGDRLTPAFTSLPSWNPHRMCGRPVIDHWSPFALLEAPFAPLDPISRWKAILVLFHVLAGLTMYALLAATGAGRDAALFAGLIYPVMTSHVSRTAIQGHMHVVMLYAVLPLLFLALFRMRDLGRRGPLVLALAIALALLRDFQRALLVVVMLGVLLVGQALFDLVRERGVGRSTRRALVLLASFLTAFVVAVAINAYGLVNRFLASEERAGWVGDEQAQWIDRWSMDAIYPFFDVNRLLDQHFSPFSDMFGHSVSRYLGMSLIALALVGALDKRVLRREERRRFWLVLLLLPLSIWLSFGREPMLDSLIQRWVPLIGAAAVPYASRLGIVLGGLALMVLPAALAAHHFDRGGRSRFAGLAVGAVATGLLLCTAPMPWLQRMVFFLKDLRNPDWFQVTISSFAIAFPAALAVSVLSRRLQERRWWPALLMLLTGLSVLDFIPGRSHLTDHQRPFHTLVEYADVWSAVAADPEDCRVLSSTRYDNDVDLAYVWHGKRLAWDFRSFSAPDRTEVLLRTIHQHLQRPELARKVATLAGVANVKYAGARPWQLLPEGGPWTVRRRSNYMSIYENELYRPFAQAYRGTHVLVGDTNEQAVWLAADLAAAGIALIQARSPSAELLDAATAVHTSARTAAEGNVPARARVIDLDHLPSFEPAKFTSEPTIAWSRPSGETIEIDTRSPESFFLLVSESFHSSWGATLDGAELTVYPGAVAFLGVFVPAGEHRVRFRFRPPAERWLFGVVALGSLTATLGGLALPRRARHRMAPRPAPARSLAVG